MIDSSKGRGYYAASTLLSVFILLLFVIGIISTPKISPAMSLPETVQLPVLMYHHLTQRQSSVGEYTLHVDRLEEDFKFLKENGYQSVTTEQIVNYINGVGELPQKPVYITFDDGFRSFLAYAVPLLEKYDMYAVVNIVGSFTDAATKTEDDNVLYSYLDWEDVCELVRNGRTEIGNHTYNMHLAKGRKGCSKKPDESAEKYRRALLSDIDEFQNQILYNTDFQPRVFAYPYGALSYESLPVMEEMGFDLLLCSEQRMNVLTRGEEGGTKLLYRFNMTPEKAALAVLNE